MSVTLSVRGAFDLAASARFLEGFAPVGSVAGRSGDLRLAFASSPTWEPVCVRLRAGPGVVTADIEARDVAAAAEHARRILSLDVDGTGFERIDDPLLADLRARHPGLRPVLFPSPYEAACWAVIGHRIRKPQAAAIKQRMAERMGERAGGLPVFPAPERLLAAEDITGLPPIKVDRLHALAHAALDGALEASHLRAMESTQALVELQKLPGIGPFSAELILIRGAGHPDVFPTAEPTLHRRMADLYHLTNPTPTHLSTIAHQWHPYRSWATFLIRATPHQTHPRRTG